MVGLLHETIRYMIPLMMVALAGVFAERSGIINIALDGIMIIGAFSCALFMKFFKESGVFANIPQVAVLLGMLLSALIGALFSLLLGYAAIKWRADQTISGTALNIMAPAIVLFVAYTFFGDSSISANGVVGWTIVNLGGENAGPLAEIFLNRTYITTPICIVIYIVMSVILYKTRFGLRLRSCGEHPQAAGSVGINVHKMRYSGTLISGALAGIGGFTYALTIDGGVTRGSVAGFGFLALAIMIFGNWKPLNIAILAIFFGMLKCIAVLDPFGTGIDSDWLSMLPYIATIAVLAFTSKKSRAPKAEGIPYDKGMR